jgi:hypothetical protein
METVAGLTSGGVMISGSFACAPAHIKSAGRNPESKSRNTGRNLICRIFERDGSRTQNSFRETRSVSRHRKNRFRAEWGVSWFSRSNAT